MHVISSLGTVQWWDFLGVNEERKINSPFGIRKGNTFVAIALRRSKLRGTFNASSSAKMQLTACDPVGCKKQVGFSLWNQRPCIFILGESDDLKKGYIFSIFFRCFFPTSSRLHNFGTFRNLRKVTRGCNHPPT